MIETQREVVVEAAFARIKRWEALDDLEQLKRDPTLIIKKGLRDPVRPFVKGEMHPSRKLDTPRLIMAISLVDQLVERFVFSDFSENEKRQYPHGANMVGFGRSLAHDRAITQKVKGISNRTKVGPTASDVSGWERRVDPEDLESIPRVIGMRMKPHPEKANWEHLASIWAIVSARPIYIVGRYLYISTNPGMMPSGTYMTSYGNGIMRMVYAFAAGAEEAVVLGDDCLEWHLDPTAAMNLYNNWGLVTREVKTYPADGKTFVFCSKFYNSENEDVPLVVPQSAGKMIATFANLKHRTPAQLVALKAELMGLPGATYCEIIEWAEKVRYALPPGVEQDA